MPKLSHYRAYKAPTMLVREQYKNQVPLAGRSSHQSTRNIPKIGRKEPDSCTESQKKFEKGKLVSFSLPQAPAIKTYILCIEKEKGKTSRNSPVSLWSTNLRTFLYLFHTCVYGILTLAGLILVWHPGNEQLLEHLWEAAAGYIGLETAKSIFQGFKGISFKVIS